jgi:hypothetical protein
MKNDEIIKRKIERYEEHYSNDEFDDDICENYQEYQKEEDDLYINETANIIRGKIFEYLHDGAYPLCEYLDINNLENYVRWLLSR